MILTTDRPDIWKYLDKVCEVWGLRKYMTFNTEVIGCYWQEDSGEWLVKLKQTQSDGKTKLFDDRCHLLLHGTGILNNFKWPKIEGMEKFKGRVSWHISSERLVADNYRSSTQQDGLRTTKPKNGRTIVLQ